MAQIYIPLENGSYWLVTGKEVVVTAESLIGMQAEAVGEKLVSLNLVMQEFQEYLRSRHRRDTFGSIEEFRAEKALNLTRKNHRHNPNSQTWQIDYVIYSPDDFRRILDEEARSPLFTPREREYLNALISHTGSWRDAANALGTTAAALRAAVYHALRKYRQAHPASSNPASSN